MTRDKGEGHGKGERRETGKRRCRCRYICGVQIERIRKEMHHSAAHEHVRYRRIEHFALGSYSQALLSLAVFE